MKDNIFQSCNTESEIMKRLFETSSNKEYSRHELIAMADKRRSELNSKEHKLDIKKIIIPEDVSNNNINAKSSILFGADPKGSSKFEFLGEGMVKF